jgi:hypothetical protein
LGHEKQGFVAVRDINNPPPKKTMLPAKTRFSPIIIISFLRKTSKKQGGTQGRTRTGTPRGGGF